MKIIIGSDHAGFEYKEDLIGLLKEKNIDFIDCGCDSPDSVDYPDYAHEAVSYTHLTLPTILLV